MPDWLIHLGIGFIVASLLRTRRKNLFLLGSILPDISRINFLTSDFIGMSAPAIFTFTEPFHTPFMMLLVALLISQFFGDWKKAFPVVFGATLLHLSLDTLINAKVADGVMLLYPFSMWNPVTSFLWMENPLAHAIRAISAVALLYALYRGTGWEKIRLPEKPHLLLIIVPIILIPLLTSTWYMNNGETYMDFFVNTEEWEGRTVGIVIAEVISDEPRIVEMGKEFVLVTGESLEKGDWVSVRGTYSGGKIHTSFVHLHDLRIKVWGSLAALLIFMLIWFREPLIHKVLKAGPDKGAG